MRSSFSELPSRGTRKEDGAKTRAAFSVFFGMKTRQFFAVFLLSASLAIPRAHALVTEHGSERLNCSGWSAPLAEIVNDKARASGRIGPLAPSARFEYTGGLEVFQRILAKYVALPQPVHVLYLQTGFDIQSDFELSITQEGQGFLHFNAGGRIPLDQIKIPTGLSVEFLPATGEPIDPEERARHAAQQKRLAAFAADHKSPSARATPKLDR